MKMHIGKIYHVLFTDHALKSPDSVLCEVFGRLQSYTEDAFIFTHWELLHEDEETRSLNRETCAIVRSAVKRVYELQPKVSHKKETSTQRKHKKAKRKIGFIQDDGQHERSEGN